MSSLILVALLAVALLGLAILHTRRDVATLLTIWLVMLYLIPARWVLGPLGGAGTPAILIGLLAAFWWVGGRLDPGLGLDREPQPARYLLLFYCWCMGVGVAAALLRPLTGLEASGVGRGLLVLLSLTSVALLAADGIHSQARVETVLRRLVGIGSAVAIIGILQRVARIDLVPFLRIPGLQLSKELWTFGDRHGMTRPGATAQHPIEFSVVMAMILPLALHFALAARERGERQRFWAATAVVFVAIPMSLSRSGLLGLVIAMGIMAIGWTWRQRARILGLGLVGFTGLWLTIPGLLGTIRGLVTGIDDDVSIQARTERIPKVLELVAERPWFGHGFGTYNLEDYFLLDNQFYKTSIEGGFVGVIGLLALLLLPAFIALRVRQNGALQAQRDLALPLVAGIFVAGITVATFDAFFYHIYRGTLFLLIGCLGALWRLSVRSADDEQSPHPAAYARW